MTFDERILFMHIMSALGYIRQSNDLPIQKYHKKDQVLNINMEQEFYNALRHMVLMKEALSC